MLVYLATSKSHPTLTESDALLRNELEARGARVTAAPWDTIPTDRSSESVVVLRSTWDYHRRPEDFRSRPCS